MKRLVHRVIIVLICGVVVYGGCRQLQTTPVANKWNDPESRLKWQADCPVDVRKSVPESGAATTSNIVETAVCSLVTTQENADSFASRITHQIDSDVVTPNRDSVASANLSAIPNQTLTTSGRGSDTGSSPEYSSWSLPELAPNSERRPDLTTETEKETHRDAASMPGSESSIAENANRGLKTVERDNPFVRNPGQSTTTPVQVVTVPAGFVKSISVTQTPDTGKHSESNNAQKTLGDRTAEHTAERPAPVPSPVIEQRAMEHLEYGKSLARRGATYAAREEYIHALRLIAESNDMQSKTRDFTGMLADGLRALKEADDFVLLDAEQQLNIDLARIIATHDSNVISDSIAMDLSPINAMQMYFQFATGKISAAVGRSTTAADVLHALGKLLQSTSNCIPAGKPIDRAKAIVMFQTALKANPADYRSANELGVLLAQNGRWEMAKELFAKSLLINKSPESWLNLSRAHEQLGEQEFARLANIEYQRLAGHSKGVDEMEWVSVQQFETDGIKSEKVITSDVPQTARKSTVEQETQGNKFINGIKKWF